ncbi:DUF4384 domain-containing protein [Laspinema olomoucense]|uniref:DUF4384 domain-containing protein n=1 Tax=Laspinema olomoucense TaxID=3231600 RepID=UPI0021BADA1B|nr:DUF4384 domain-containing protein [Laspinema sp. D3c]MCT7996825.1 DUF4384 domain-containing protein [Laspinema sp. D3c]
MIELPLANSFHEEFLNNFTNDVIPSLGSDNERFCCWYRFHPKHKNIRNTDLAVQINEEALNNSFTQNIEQCLGNVLKKIILRFGEKMAADGIALDLLPRTRGRQPQHSDYKAPWQIIYQWLWEIDFPRQGWKLAEETATYAMEELQMIDLKSQDRDLCLNGVKNPVTIYKGEEYALQVDFPQTGHLLLINQGVSGTRYCLCPSLGYSVDTQVMPEKKLHIPGIKALASSLQYTDIGNEYFLAILTDHPVQLSWVNPNYKPGDIVVTEERLREIFQQVGRQWNARVFSKKFEVVESG